MKRGNEMENEEERKVAKEVKSEFIKKDNDLAKSYGAKIYDYLYENDTSYRGGRSEDCPDSFGKELRVFIENGGTPGDFFIKNIGRMKGYISEELLPYMFKSLDTLNEWQIDWRYSYRRSYKGKSDYNLYLDRIPSLIDAYRMQTNYGYDIYSLIKGEVPERLACYFKHEKRNYLNEYYIAAKLDEGDEKLEELLTDILYGDTGTVSLQLIRAIFMSHNEKMFELIGKTLVAARLSEGLRQAICENMDCGNKESFIYVLNVILENNLIRFSSVKRSIGVYTGLAAYDTKDIDRINDKLLALIVRALSEDGAIEEMLSTEDSMQIYIGLWALGFVDIKDAMHRAVKLSKEGSRHQRLVACYFLSYTTFPYVTNVYAKEIVKQFSDDDETLALIMPRFMGGIRSTIYNTLYPGKENRYTSKDKYKSRVYVKFGSYFESVEECREFNDLLYKILDRIPKKEIVFEPSVFPWHKAMLTSTDIVIRIAFCASALKDEQLILKAAGLLKDISGDSGYRADVVELLLREPNSPELFDILTQAVVDAETSTRDIAYNLLKQELETDRTADLPKEIASPVGRLPERSYMILEDCLRLKKADIRANLLKLLATRGPEEKLEMLQRLFSDGKEEKVTAGLDIILQMKNNEDELYAAAAETIKYIEKPTTKESILIEQIQGAASKESEEEELFYDKNAEYTPVVDDAYMEEAMDIFYKLFPDSEVADTLAGTESKGLGAVIKKLIKGKRNKTSAEKELEFVKKLDDLIEANKNLEYETTSGMELLGNGIYATPAHVRGEGSIAFAELWDKFEEENEVSEGQLVRLQLRFDNDTYGNGIIGFKEYFEPLMAKMFGPLFGAKGSISLKHPQQVSSVLGYFCRKRDTYKKYRGYIAAIVCSFLNVTKDSTEYKYTFDKFSNRWERERADKKKTYSKSIFSHYAIREIVSGIRSDDRNFPIHYALKTGLIAKHIKNESMSVYAYTDGWYAGNGKGPHSVDYIGAAANGYISKDFLYKKLLEENRIKEAVNAVSSITKYIRESDKSITTRGRSYWWTHYRQNEMVNELLKCNVAEQENDEFTDIQKKKLEIAEECYENISKLIMSKELVRGDTETEYSGASLSLSRVYGLDYLVRILSALGSETLDRTSYFYSYSNRAISKRESMSHLLSVCIPDPKEGDAKEQADKLKKLLKGTDIKEARLIETGLYSPEWLPIIGEYLGWEGFMSGCYYFMAHMNERFDDKRAAIIAKYTPLTEEELNVGAFDINWFNEVYETLGKKRFDEIYKAAKYISDGAKHTRARKYADAARGEMDAAKTAEEIGKKRNKDLLMAYALIPCNDKEKTERYAFIQKYLKESKQFGAQRRASEKAAAEMAVKNLATASGYSDETRFILRMEREISSELVGFFEPHEVDDYTVWLEADDAGKVSVLVKKGEKILKSVPAGIKKKDYVVDITEAKKTFTEQFRRTKIMMEEAMESETEFYVSEILDMASDRVVGTMVNRILFMQGDFFGFPEDMKEAGLKADSTVVVAHPYNLFKAGRWHEFQKFCFEKEIRQPFKQIFRELYVKTEEEKNLNESMRYAGNQINPKMTVGVLRGRRWVADAEDGLQKVYYKENIIATIYALADWFSPSDIEAPTLEWVAFYDRKTFERKQISEIPDILFSEVMRDVDLAVSVAHAGDIDPEMSHSTIEMRHAIAEFLIPMFKLKNVTLTDSHALIEGTRGKYNIHLGSGVIHQEGGPMINVLPVHSQHRGRIFLPFVDDDPKTAEVMSKIIFFAEDKKIKDPYILDQII